MLLWYTSTKGMEPHIRHQHTMQKLGRLLGYVFVGMLFTLALVGAVYGAITWKLEQDKMASKAVAVEYFNKILDDNTFSLPEGSSHAPYELDTDTLIDVVARNQPAVVRILATTCADMVVTSQQSSLRVSDACLATSGSGSIISSNGYVATSGHVLDLSVKDILLGTLTSKANQETYLNFLEEGGLISASSAQEVRTAIEVQGSALSSVLESTKQLLDVSLFTVSNRESHYSVQLSNQPAQLLRDGERIAIRTGDGVVAAELVAQDFEVESANSGLSTGLFKTSDVALLKMTDKAAYPYIELGAITGIRRGDELTAIGFPSILNHANETDASIIVPSVTQGSVLDIYKDAPRNGRNIISTDIPISQGNSGGPALDVNGRQVGLSTYAILECDASEVCFGNGQLRDVADIKSLAQKSDITFEYGNTNQAWQEILDTYQLGDYIATVDKVSALLEDYPYNYLAASLASVARGQIGERTDTSGEVQSQRAVSSAWIMLASGGALLLVVLIYAFLHINILHGHALVRHARSQKTDDTQV